MLYVYMNLPYRKQENATLDSGDKRANFEPPPLDSEAQRAGSSGRVH